MNSEVQDSDGSYQSDELEKKLHDLFIFLSQAFNESQTIMTLSPDTPVKEAIDTLVLNNYSQIPVVVGSQVLGVFSYRSFAQKLLHIPDNDRAKLSINVDEFIENFKFSNISDELMPLIDEFELKDAILIGTERKLQGIITTVDVLKLFIKLSMPYIMLREIELTIRQLIKYSVSDNDLLICSQKVLKHYADRGEEIPTSLESMTMADCISIITYGDYWEEYFSKIFGNNRNIASTYLRPIPQLRNDIFHFRKEITNDEFSILERARNWLLVKYKKHMASQEDQL